MLKTSVSLFHVKNTRAFHLVVALPDLLTARPKARKNNRVHIGAVLLAIISASVISCLNTCFIPPAHSQTSGSTNIIRKTTSGGSVDVTLQLPSSHIVKSTKMNLTVTFKQKGSNKTIPHIDYDAIMSKDGNDLFQASSLAGSPGDPVHAPEGTFSIPFTFQQAGKYLLNITAYSVQFNPINPEFAEFYINVS